MVNPIEDFDIFYSKAIPKETLFLTPRSESLHRYQAHAWVAISVLRPTHKMVTPS